MKTNDCDQPKGTTRRDFLASSASAVAGASVLSSSPNVHAAGSDVIRVGLIGCGGRGTGAAGDALHAGSDVRLVAMGDMFRERLEESRRRLRSDSELAAQIDVPDSRCFVGFDAFKQVIASGVDVVLLATPPHFRAMHIQAAVEAGKHIFAEKPVAVDAPGVRKVLAACDEAKKKGLSVVSGLCWRYSTAMRETMRRVHEKAIGDIVALQCNYNAQGLWVAPRKPGWGDMEWQIRNWLYFTWLSGDHIVEQHIHSLDKMAWAMKDEYPVRATGLGGRQVRTGAEYGHIFDHHAVVYEYANGTRLFSYCRQQDGTQTDVSDHLFGTKGTCDTMRFTIKGPKTWRYRAAKDERDNMFHNEHKELFASIRAGKPINNGDYMAKSTLMAIMGRMATYTGQLITWEMALNSQEDLTPPKYDLAAPLSVPPVAMPGITKFV